MTGRDLSDQEFMTVAEVATILKLNQQTVRNWIDRDEVPAVRVGRRVRILRSDFDALVAGAESQPLAPGPSIWDGEIPDPALPES
jgi:excisionase family DNA binding protein